MSAVPREMRSATIAMHSPPGPATYETDPVTRPPARMTMLAVLP
jgi:hypothetical protein